MNKPFSEQRKRVPRSDRLEAFALACVLTVFAMLILALLVTVVVMTKGVALAIAGLIALIAWAVYPKLDDWT